MKPFYDDYEKASLWGKDLFDHLDWVYSKSASFCVLFASENYASKVWTTHERRSAQVRALESSQEYVLPVRFDDTEIPGLRSTITYVDARSLQPAKLAKLITEKIGPKVRANNLPDDPDKLYAALGVESPADICAVQSVANSFMQALTRMTVDERRLIAHFFMICCPSELPDNVHVEIDLMRRDLSLEPVEIIERIRAMSSIGIEHEVRFDDDHGEVLVARWLDRTIYDDDFTSDFAEEYSTEIAEKMIVIGTGSHCRHCAENCILRLDFSLLATPMSGR